MIDGDVSTDYSHLSDSSSFGLQGNKKEQGIMVHVTRTRNTVKMFLKEQKVLLACWILVSALMITLAYMMGVRHGSAGLVPFSSREAVHQEDKGDNDTDTVMPGTTRIEPSDEKTIANEFRCPKIGTLICRECMSHDRCAWRVDRSLAGGSGGYAGMGDCVQDEDCVYWRTMNSCKVRSDFPREWSPEKVCNAYPR